MGNFSKQQEEKKEARNWDKTVKETLAKYFFDLSKLVFTAIVLGGFVPLFANEYKCSKLDGCRLRHFRLRMLCHLWI